MSVVKISRWGNSHGLRISRALMEQAHLHEGDVLDASLNERGEIVLAPLTRIIRASDLDAVFAAAEEAGGARSSEEFDSGTPQGEELI